MGLLERLQAEKPKTEAQFQPLSDQFDILKKYEVLIPDPVSNMETVYSSSICMCVCKGAFVYVCVYMRACGIM